MQFKIDDFIVRTDTEIIQLEEKIITPTKLSYNKKPEEYKIKNKTKEITVFHHLSYLEKNDKKYYSVISDLFVFIDLIEVLKAFNSNKLNTNKKYNLSDKFTAEIAQDKRDIAQDKRDINLKIHFKNYSNSLYLDKFECSSLASKFSKILSRCEVWQESEV